MKKSHFIFGGIAIIVVAVIVIVLLAMSAGPQQNADPTQNTKPSESTPTYEVGDALEEAYPTLSGDAFHVDPESLPSSEKRSDFDGDGLNNADEISHGTDMYKVDTDEDGISDYDEIKTTQTDPVKWSSRDDNVSDLEYWLTRAEGFSAGWSSVDFSGFKVYIEKPEDRLWIIRKVKTEAFAELETISEAYQIDNYSGTLGVDMSRFVEEVVQSVAVYKVASDGSYAKEQSAVDQGMLMFPVNDDDIFILVYEPVEGMLDAE